MWRKVNVKSSLHFIVRLLTMAVILYRNKKGNEIERPRFLYGKLLKLGTVLSCFLDKLLSPTTKSCSTNRVITGNDFPGLG